MQSFGSKKEEQSSCHKLLPWFGTCMYGVLRGRRWVGRAKEMSFDGTYVCVSVRASVLKLVSTHPQKHNFRFFDTLP